MMKMVKFYISCIIIILSIGFALSEKEAKKKNLGKELKKEIEQMKEQMKQITEEFNSRLSQIQAELDKCKTNRSGEDLPQTNDASKFEERIAKLETESEDMKENILLLASLDNDKEQDELLVAATLDESGKDEKEEKDKTLHVDKHNVHAVVRNIVSQTEGLEKRLTTATNLLEQQIPRIEALEESNKDQQANGKTSDTEDMTPEWIKDLQKADEELDNRINDINVYVLQKDKYDTINERLHEYGKTSSSQHDRLESLKEDSILVKEQTEEAQEKVKHLYESYIQLIDNHESTKSRLDDFQSKLNDAVGFTASIGSQPKCVNQKLSFDVIRSNVGQRYDADSGVFTVDIKGLYYISVLLQPASSIPQTAFFNLKSNDETLCDIHLDGHTSSKSHDQTNTCGGIFKFNVGDTIYLDCLSQDVLKSIGNGEFCTFTGFLIQPHL